MSYLSEHYAGKESPGDDDRWRVVENKYSFTVECDRPRPHITIVYGDGPMSIPNYGTKDQAKADAETIAKALNARSMPAAAPVTGQPSAVAQCALPDRERMAEILYTSAHAKLRNCWKWSDPELDHEHPTSRGYWYKIADGTLAALTSTVRGAP